MMLTLRAPVKSIRPKRGHALVVQNSAYWTLHQTGTPKGRMAPSIDLTGCLSTHHACTLGSKDTVSAQNDFTIMNEYGLHLMFEEHGKHNHTLDSDSVLYMTDVDSRNDVYLDGVLVPRGARVACRPGSLVSLEGGPSFVVERNLVAHA